jgi:uncharacterized protein YcfJ
MHRSKRSLSMKKIVVFTALAAVAAMASAQQQPRQGQEQGRVLSATPVTQQVGVPRQVCGNETVYSGNRTSGAGAVIGAIAGGAAGNAVGRGHGRSAATALGVIGGAVLGNQVEGGQPQYQNVQRCTTETYYENRTLGYDVVYEYAGRQYTTRTATDPGPWLPLSVQPADQGYAGGQSYSTNQAYPGGQTYTTQPDPYATQGAYSQPGVITSTYPVEPVYQQAPVYAAPAVTLELGYGGYGRPYYPHRGGYWR